MATAIKFRFIVSAEDGCEHDDLKLTRLLMAQVEQDLGTKLDWVAVDHCNTGPHPRHHRAREERSWAGPDHRPRVSDPRHARTGG
jgi:type IV secretory pathway VirD2 relaxase